ncbi:alanine--tRNA ligase-related protein [Bacillus wiedmannii]|uniref:alanine--tRNA ligase-related protein n=1 Tax=Bacillus wiedmannii TaxID=1890302 RepID=UPI000BED3696|nr:alanine--tRNA ligase-related protein [Bacillus wiedmannii]PEF38678.1 hypothetical protein CON72_11845 [Bacillus wiedmannii]
MIENLTQSYINYYTKKHYQIQENINLSSLDDPTLFFVNSNIAVFKEFIKNNKFIPDTAQVQDCFRSNGNVDDSSLLLSFKMIGNVAMIESINTILNDFISFLIEIGQVPSKYIYGVISENDQDLQALWQSTILTKNMVLITDNEFDDYPTRWTYGKGYEFTGRGLTFVCDNPDVPKCSLKCNIFCNCSKYLAVGNLIIVESKLHQNKYVDLGCGLERIASYKYKNELYLLPEMKDLVEKITNLGFNDISAKKIINLMRGIFKLIAEEVYPSNKKEGYILKSLIKYLINEIILLTSKDINLINNIYNSIFQIMKHSDNKINDNYNIILLSEIHKFVLNMNKNITLAQKFIRKNITCPKEKLHQRIKETFGLPPYIVNYIIKKQFDN